MGLQIYNEI